MRGRRRRVALKMMVVALVVRAMTTIMMMVLVLLLMVVVEVVDSVNVQLRGCYRNSYDYNWWALCAQQSCDHLASLSTSLSSTSS